MAIFVHCLPQLSMLGEMCPSLFTTEAVKPFEISPIQVIQSEKFTSDCCLFLYVSGVKGTPPLSIKHVHDAFYLESKGPRTD